VYTGGPWLPLKEGPVGVDWAELSHWANNSSQINILMALMAKKNLANIVFQFGKTGPWPGLVPKRVCLCTYLPVSPFKLQIYAMFLISLLEIAEQFIEIYAPFLKQESMHFYQT
jgi:hypothetical protein